MITWTTGRMQLAHTDPNTLLIQFFLYGRVRAKNITFGVHRSYLTSYVAGN